jgi:hypothetical protein
MLRLPLLSALLVIVSVPAQADCLSACMADVGCRSAGTAAYCSAVDSDCRLFCGNPAAATTTPAPQQAPRDAGSPRGLTLALPGSGADSNSPSIASTVPPPPPSSPPPSNAPGRDGPITSNPPPSQSYNPPPQNYNPPQTNPPQRYNPPPQQQTKIDPKAVRDENDGTGRRYGAIAFSPTSQSWGDSYRYHSQGSAQDRAMGECGTLADDCVVAVWFYNNCGAVASDPNGTWGSAFSNSAPLASRAAIADCRKSGGQNCTVQHSVCSR